MGMLSGEKVMGMLSGENFEDELKKVVNKYKENFGGVFIWEYFNSNPVKWLNTITNIYGLSTSTCFIQ